MDADDFRKHAHRLVDWMADYLESVDELAVVPEVTPGDVRAKLPGTPPVAGEGFEAIFADFLDTIVPGMTHWNHPGFFGYFPANHSPPSILAEMLTATLGAQCMSWQTSPAATELEQVVMDWLAQMLALPDGFTGVIQDTASTGTLVALLTARERVTGGGFGARGCDGQPGPMTVYASTEAHSSIDKAVKLAGFGTENLRRIAVDDAYAMRPDDLRARMAADRAAGVEPVCVIATVGTTSSTAVDPLAAIGEVCQAFDAWLHVDAAYAGSAAILPEKRNILDGVEHADSFLFNPHKWLLTNLDCSAYFVRDPDALLTAFAHTPEYLKTAYDAEAPNFRDWGIQLGRRFRALKLWFVLRSYGVEGLQEMLRRHIALAAEFAGRVDAHPDFERLAPAPFGLVCFRHRPGGLDDPAALDAHNEALLARINAHPELFLTHTRLGGRYTLRMSIGQWQTQAAHVDHAWQLIQDTAAV